MRLTARHGACDCHSHVYGPYETFPLPSQRTFDAPESPIEQLEQVWQALGIERAVLIQGSAHGEDHRALTAAVARSPKTRKGVALLRSNISDAEIETLDRAGICAVRFNWVSHLLAGDSRSEEQRLQEAADILERVNRLGWHVEIHLDIADIGLATRLNVPEGMPIVIDHMARIDASAATISEQVAKLLRLVEYPAFWFKLSGADRIASRSDSLATAMAPVRSILEAAPQRCVWGLDWPHVNLDRKRSDTELVDLLVEAAGDEEVLNNVLICNPERLYGFDPAAGSLQTFDPRAAGAEVL